MKAKFFPLALLSLFSTAAFAQEYAIKLQRAEKPGNRYKVSMAASESEAMNMTVNGVSKQNSKSETAAQFEGTETITEVDAGGVETKVSLTVDKFTLTQDGKTVDVLPKGTVVTARVADHKQIYEVKGKPAGPAATQALDLLVSLGKGSNTTDDEIFGTPDKKKKGDTWDMDSVKFTERFKKSAGGPEITKLTGKMTFEDVTGDSMTINAHMTGVVKPPLPQGFAMDSSALDATMKASLPVDTTKAAPYDSLETMSCTLSAHADAPTGEKIVVKQEMSQSSDHKKSPINYGEIAP